MNKLILPVILVLFNLSTYGQTSADVLEKGRRVKDGQALFLQISKEGDKHFLLHGIANSFADVELESELKNESLLLCDDEAVSVFVLPYNPLKYSVSFEKSVYSDPIDTMMNTTINNIVDVFSFLVESSDEKGDEKPCVAVTNELKTSLLKLKAIAKEDKIIEQTTTIFKDLTDIGFDSEKKARKGLDDVLVKIDTVKASQKRLAKYIKELDEIWKALKEEKCISELTFESDYALTEMTSKFKNYVGERANRISAIEKIYQKVDSVYAVAESTKHKNINWLIKLDPIIAEKGKIHQHDFKINQITYKNEGGKIEVKETKEVHKVSVRVRKFQRFVYETSGGVVYTFLDYKTFDAEADSLGVYRVTEKSDNLMNNFNISAMANFNYYIPNSSVHPFLQVGAGLNGGIPTFLAGAGLRIHTSGAKRLAFSGGFASTWLQELDGIGVGDIVGGKQALDEKVVYKFHWPLRGYVGFQFNF